MECKGPTAASGYEWQLGDDCGALGQSCVAGACQDASTGGSCPNVAGSWTITQHCEGSLIGAAYAVTQSQCSFSIATVGWSGAVDAQGHITMSGEGAPGTTLTCTGTVDATGLQVDCTPGPCHVEMIR
jgi:hypothetical protein